MKTLHNHARHELKLYGITMGDDYELYQSIMRMLRRVAELENEGAIEREEIVSILSRLLRKEPLRPLQGTEDEWELITPGLKRNKRSSRVIMDEEGICWDVLGEKIVRPLKPDVYRKVRIEFPYTPKTKVLRRKVFGRWV